MIKIEGLGCNIFVSNNNQGDYEGWISLSLDHPTPYEFDGERYYLQEKREDYLPFLSAQRVRNLFLAILSTIVSLGFALLHPTVRQWFMGRQVVRILCPAAEIASSEEIKTCAKEKFRQRLNEEEGNFSVEEKQELLGVFGENEAPHDLATESMITQYAVAFARLAPKDVALRNELLDLLLSDCLFQMNEEERLEEFGPQPVFDADANVHSRDLVSRRAIEILRRRQGNLSLRLQKFLVGQCCLFLEQFPIEEIRTRALQAALGKSGRNLGGFSAFLDPTAFNIDDWRVTGPEILARLWAFTQIYTDPLNPNGQHLAESGIAQGLASCIEDGLFGHHRHRVCQPGKTGRLVTAVLQGRLKGMASDVIELSPEEAVNQFFCDNDPVAVGNEMRTKGWVRGDLLGQIGKNKGDEHQAERARLEALLMEDLDGWLLENPIQNPDEVKQKIREQIAAELSI